jgi:AraC family transcriptional regulator of adaptative response/methylated-DNA-[protein]-cysteine methyltransferase
MQTTPERMPHSRFLNASKQLFGSAQKKTPAAAGVMTAWVRSPLGSLLVGSTSKGICLLEFTDRKRLRRQLSQLKEHFHCRIVPGENRHTVQLRRELSEYFAGKRKRFSVKLVYPGTPFQQKVWRALQTIPYGATVSYEHIATTIGSPGASRAVGSANGSNRISIVIPCHRVINKNGGLGGYGGGLRKKKMLLSLEQRSDKGVA